MEKEPIAIVGLACRYPGANTINEFWDNLINGYDAIQATPPNRYKHWLNDIRGGFVSDIDAFDAEFFGISTDDAVLMDPQHRILLETTWHALEDAGYDPRRLSGADVSVFVGSAGNEYEQLVIQHDKNPSLESHLGIHPAVIAGRLSHQFGLCGKSITVNTACSSSLVAIELACQDLWCNKSTLAICAGVNLIFSPHISERFNNSNWLSREGVCKSLDSDADGYVRSEGIGVAVLKLYSQAKADGDRIYAVVRDCCVKHNGRGNGLALPSLPAQVDILSKIYSNSDIDPDSISYIEASAVGAKVGDVIELKALSAVIGKQRSIGNPLRVGSVKPNIGNSEAASGIAGFIKVALTVFYKRLVPTIHYKSVSPAILLDKMGLHIQSSLEDLSGSDLTVRAGISSFGFSGTNAHILLEENPSEKKHQSSCGPLQLIMLSAKTGSSLKNLVENFYGFLIESPASEYANISFTANLKRCHFEHRVAIVARSKEQLISSLSEYLTSGSNHSITQYNAARPSCPPKYGFEFTGKCRLARHVYDYAYASSEQFRLSLASCEQIIKTRLHLDLADAVDADEAATNDILRNFLAEYVVYKLLLSWGLNPDCCMGSGLGIYSAACCAGLIAIDDVIQLMLNGNEISYLFVTEPSKRVFYPSCAHVDLQPGGIAEALPYEKVTQPALSIHSLESNTSEHDALLSLHIGTGKVYHSVDVNNDNDNSGDVNLCLANKSLGGGGCTSALTIESLFLSLVALSREGIDVDLGLVCAYQNCQILSLPPYPFKRRRFLVGDTVEYLSSELPISTSVDRDFLELLPPTTELQRQLHALWSDVLGHANFGITDNFFLVGGHSLAASHLSAAIEQFFEFSPTIAQLFLRTTILEQAEWILERNNSSTVSNQDHQTSSAMGNSNLVMLQPLGDKLPIFAIHGVVNSMAHFIFLARELAPHRKIYGLQQDDNAEEDLELTTVEAMAAKYADQILKVQPDGLIHVLGYSAGGWYAHAVADALLQRGASIGAFIIIDSHALIDIHLRIGIKIFMRKLSRQLGRCVKSFANPSDQRRRRVFRGLVSVLNHDLESYLNFRVPHPLRELKGGLARHKDPYVRLLKTGYRPKRLPIAVDLFTPEPNVRTLAPLWRFYCQAGITVHPMFETHTDFYKKPELTPVLAAALEEALQRAESAAEAATVRPGFTSR